MKRYLSQSWLLALFIKLTANAAAEIFRRGKATYLAVLNPGYTPPRHNLLCRQISVCGGCTAPYCGLVLQHLSCVHCPAGSRLVIRYAQYTR